ncbi:MAG: hypothetical protein ACKPKO_19205, partial [Candidatus Fonsibacter sp.]
MEQMLQRAPAPGNAAGPEGSAKLHGIHGEQEAEGTGQSAARRDVKHNSEYYIGDRIDLPLQPKDPDFPQLGEGTVSEDGESDGINDITPYNTDWTEYGREMKDGPVAEN